MSPEFKEQPALFKNQTKHLITAILLGNSFKQGKPRLQGIEEEFSKDIGQNYKRARGSNDLKSRP